MSDFRSVWQRQIELVMIMPHKDSMMNGYAIKSVTGFRSSVTRSMPYPQDCCKDYGACNGGFYMGFG